jgi:ABC-type phosphate/phosphonate transport system permease subunit
MENDKTASWLVIITFLAISLAITFAFLELKELQSNNLFSPIDKLF